VSDLRSIAVLYEQVDNHFDDLRDDFDEAGRERVEQEQRINDQAYFVLAWGQLGTGLQARQRRRRGAFSPYMMVRMAPEIARSISATV